MTDPALAIATPLIAGFESFWPIVYRDGGGIPTQAYGCTFHPNGTPVAMGDPPVTEPEGMAWMQALLVPTMARVRALVRVPISDDAAAALCSFAYNTGTGALANSTLLRLLNEGKADWAADQFRAWIHDAHGNVEPGLVRRRDVEKALFLKADDPKGLSPNPATIAASSVKTAPEEITPDTDESDLLDSEFNAPEQS